VPELREGLRLDLADPLSSDVKLPPTSAKVRGWPSSNPNRKHDLLLPLGQGVEDRLELLLEEGERHGVVRHHRVGVLDEVSEVGVLLLAQRSPRSGNVIP
jgi:hypothetical protein